MDVKSDKTIAKTIGTRLLYLLDDHSMTQRALAEEVDAQPQAIGNYIAGKVVPTVQVLIKMAKALDTTPDYLLGISDDKYGFITIDGVKTPMYNNNIL